MLTRKPRKGADGHRRQHARLRQFSEVQKPRYIDLDLGSGQGHISMHNTCRTTNLPNHVTVISPMYRNMVIWISRNIDIPRSLNSRDSFLGKKFENRAPTSCRPGPILSLPTISFELRENGGKIDLNVQFSEVQKLRDHDLDLASGRGHTGPHIWSMSTYIHTKLGRNQTNYFCGGTDGRTYTDVRTDDTPEFQPISHGDDLTKNNLELCAFLKMN